MNLLSTLSNFDLHVIGAGPVGSISALAAIRNHNLKVLVSEEHKIAGVPVNCSGLFSIDGLEGLREFVDYKKTIINKMHGATIDFAGVKLNIDAKKDVAYVCNRAKFDAILAENAEAEGAKIVYGKRVENGDFQSNNIIGADGPNSFVASYFGFPRIYKFVSTLQGNVKYCAENPHAVELFFSNSAFPGFFGWIIPHNEEESEFGCGVVLPNNVSDAFARLLKIKKIRKIPKISSAVIPIEARSKTALATNSKNILLVGDAAGQTKPTTGGGVIFGGNCAKLAGKYYNDPLNYELSWRFMIGPDIFAQSLIHNQLASKNDQEMQKIGEKLKAAGIEAYLSKKGHMDKPSKMISIELFDMLLKTIL